MTATDDQDDLDEEPRDRRFNPYRLPKSNNAKQLVADVLHHLDNYEDHFGTRKRKRRAKDQQSYEAMVEAILCDLIHVHISAPNKKLHISLSKRTDNRIKRYTPSSFGKTLPDVLAKLSSKELDFVVMRKGYQGYFGEGRQTTLQPSKRLISRIEELKLDLCDLMQDTNQEVIILKKSKEDHWDNGPWIDYQDNEITNAYRQEVNRINHWLASADIDSEPLESGKVVDVSDRLMKRIFNNSSFSEGGRLFGGFWQQLKKEERKDCLGINGSFVTTLDYSQAAPKIAYSLAGVTPPNADAYAIPFYETPKHRKSVKKVFNALLYSDKPLNRFPRGARDGMEKTVKFAHLQDSINKIHQPIAHLFCKGIGLEMMLIESKILLRALLACIDHNIVALPVHDALIVAEEDADMTRAIMLEAFKAITNVDGQVEEE